MGKGKNDTIADRRRCTYRLTARCRRLIDLIAERRSVADGESVSQSRVVEDAIREMATTYGIVENSDRMQEK